jgi:hypothetical protein
MAALVRQWLASQRYLTTPSAALVKALLLNGATNITPGQYGTGAQREIPAAWPNSVEGWGRAAITDTVGLGGDDRIWLSEGAGLQNGAVASFTLNISAGQPLRVTLAWTDRPGEPFASKTLIDDLDLEVETPDGVTLRGNASADLRSDCRDAGGADRCNNVESVEIAAPAAGTYGVRVRGSVVPSGPQPFAVVAQARAISDAEAPGAPVLRPIDTASDPVMELGWDAVGNATYYYVQQSDSSDFTTIRMTTSTTSTTFALVGDVGTYYFRARACNEKGCGPYGDVRSATVTVPPKKTFMPVISR